MDDLISRKAAIDKLRDLYQGFFMTDPADSDRRKGIDSAIVEICMLPQIVTEQKKSKWVMASNGKRRHECDKCRDYAPCDQDGNEDLSAYCPHCGARMKGRFIT